MRKENDVRPFGFMDKLGYMLGDFGNDLTFVFSSMILLKFYSDVMGVSVALVGLMMTVVRFVNVVAEVIMGQIVDRSKATANGKFKPWILRMCGPVAVASFLMYASWFKDMPMAFKVFWMFFTYLLWGSVFYTSVNIPYGCMVSAISADTKDRTQLSSFRTIGASLAHMAVGVVLPILVYETDAAGYKVLSGGRVSIAAAVCSIGAVICYLLCCNLCTERVKIKQKTERFDLGKMLRGLLTNKALIGFVVVFVCMLLVQLTQQAMITYVYPNYFKNTTAQSAAGLAGMIITLILAGFTAKLSAQFGRKELAIFASLFGAAVNAVLFFIQTDNVWVFTGFYAVSYVGPGIFSLICWAMITDVIDDTEVRTGSRSDGEIYSICSLARKLGQAASSTVAGILLSAIAYNSETQFEAAVTHGIYNMSCLAPVIGSLLLVAALAFLYPLNKKRVESNAKILTERRTTGK